MPEPPPDGDLDRLLEYVNERRNFDFRGYKRASLGRRISKRMQEVGAEDYEAYMEVLEANPGEFIALFNTILINVTALRRDREAWDALIDVLVPTVVDSKGSDQPIRIWSAGTASGEEAYTLAVLFAEALGEERFRKSVKIYATDADEDALNTARQGRYPEAELISAFGEERTKRFFESDDGIGTFRSELRRALIFGRHDLVQDPPISKLDLITCRNTLMYFSSDVQLRVLTNFHFGLVPGGLLFLGKSESLVTRTGLFEAVDLRQHIFRKIRRTADLGLLLPGANNRSIEAGNDAPPGDSVFEQNAIAQIVIDHQNALVMVNREAWRAFDISQSDLGRSLFDLDMVTDPLELRSALERVRSEHRPGLLHDVRMGPGQDNAPLVFEMSISPLGHEGSLLLSLIDVTRYERLQDQLEVSQRQLESAYEELQSAVEELETTNEELQSTNEELETTNEELQSTNEELETTNEELQSTNEELETINTELSERGEEIDELNRFLASILGSIQAAVIVLDTQMEVRAWNRQAEDLWGLRSDEVLGRHFLNLDIGFPVDRVRTAVRECLSGRKQEARVVEPAVNRRGRHISCSVTINPLLGESEPRGVILLMETVTAEEDPVSAERSGA